MRNIKKVLSVILCVSLLLSMQVFALEFKDVTSDNKNSEAIDVLSSLGIIKGYEDGVFMPEKTITRAEMTTLLMRLLNLSISGTSVLDSGYTDVANNHWAVYDIKTASTMKIINGYGGGLFGPEDSVTYEQAVKMVVCMLGYESEALNKGGWPDGYIAQALDLGILKGAQMTQTEPAPRGIIAQILYNSLEVDLMAERKSANDDTKSYYINYGHNLMTDYMRLEKVEGMVTANSKTRLDNVESELADDQIEITYKGESNQYSVGNFEEAIDMIGLTIVAYVKYDDYNINKVIQHMMAKSKLEMVEIAAEDIVDFDSSKLRIVNEKTGKTVDYKISNSAVYMYNGKAIDEEYLFEEDLAIPEIGSVTLVDSGSGYDYIEIESYKNYVVKSVDSSEYLIYLDNTVGNISETSIYAPVDKKLDYSVSIKKNGNDIALSSIKKGNIISVKETVSEAQIGIQNIEILVSDTKATGKITEEDSEYVKVEGKEYGISPSLDGTTLASKIVYGASGTFYIDAFGDIAYAEFSTGGAYKYGYVINAGMKSSGEGNEANIRIFDYTSGTSKLFDFHSRVKINEEDATDNLEDVIIALEEAAEELDDASGSNMTYAQPIKYLLNNQGRISEIITVNSSNDETMQDISYNDEGVYNSTNKYFDMGSQNVKIDSKTIIIEVPLNRFDTAGYAKRSVSYFKNKFPYEIHLIGENESGSANIVIAYEPNVDKDVYYNTPTYIVKDMKKVSVDDEFKTRLNLINFQTGAESTLYCANDSYIEDVEIGDVIRFGKETNGDINENVYIYLDISEAKDSNHPEVITDADDMPSTTPVRSIIMAENYTDPYRIKPINDIGAYYAYIYATPYSVSDNSFELTDLIPGEDGFEDLDDDGVMDKPTSIANFTATSSTMFYTINSSNEITVTKGSTEEDDMMGKIFSYKDYPGTNDYVYTYIVNESLKAVYIIKVD